MIYSTLPHLSGKSFTALGIVAEEGAFGIGGRRLPQVLSEIDRQAKSLGADAVIDIKVTRTGDNVFLIMGTAVKLVV